MEVIGAWFLINKNPCKKCIVKTTCDHNKIPCDIYRTYIIKKDEKLDIIKSITLILIMISMLLSVYYVFS